MGNRVKESNIIREEPAIVASAKVGLGLDLGLAFRLQEQLRHRKRGGFAAILRGGTFIGIGELVHGGGVIFEFIVALALAFIGHILLATGFALFVTLIGDLLALQFLLLGGQVSFSGLKVEFVLHPLDDLDYVSSAFFGICGHGVGETLFS